ncbi:hypothetical protein HK096_002846, partial [Nowakowskiella sp. JEL0078]
MLMNKSITYSLVISLLVLSDPSFASTERNSLHEINVHYKAPTSRDGLTSNRRWLSRYPAIGRPDGLPDFIKNTEDRENNNNWSSNDNNDDNNWNPDNKKNNGWPPDNDWSPDDNNDDWPPNNNQPPNNNNNNNNNQPTSRIIGFSRTVSPGNTKFPSTISQNPVLVPSNTNHPQPTNKFQISSSESLQMPPKTSSATSTPTVISVLPWRSNHMMFKAENGIYMFGGSLQDGSISRDIFYVNASDLMRQNMTSKIKVPGSIIGQSCVSYTNQVAICSGGFMQNSTGSYSAQNKIWWFEKERFFELNVTGDFISRGFHSSSIVKDILYIFGGQTCLNCLSPVYLGTEETFKIHLKSVKVEPLYTSPPTFTVGALSHVSSVSLSNYILLIGGGGALDSNGISGKSTRNTTFVLFDTQATPSNYFRVINTTLGPPPGIGYTAESFDESLVVITGGCSVPTSTSGTWTCSFDAGNSISPLSCTGLNPSAGEISPGQLCRNAATSIDKYMVSHGGYVWNGNIIGLQGAQTRSDLLIFDTNASTWNFPNSLLGSVTTSVSSATSSNTPLVKVNSETLQVNGSIALYILIVIFGITIFVILGLVVFCLVRKRKAEKDGYMEVESSGILEEHAISNISSLETKNSDPQLMISMETPNYNAGYNQTSNNVNFQNGPQIIFPLPPSLSPPNLKRISITRPSNSLSQKFEVVKALLVPVTKTEMHAIRDRREFTLPDIRPITPLDDEFIRRRTTRVPDRKSSKKSLRNLPDIDDSDGNHTPSPLPFTPAHLTNSIIPQTRPTLFESQLQHDVQADSKDNSESKYIDIDFDTEVYSHAVAVARESTKRRLLSQVEVERKSSDSQDAIDNAINVAGAALRRGTVLDHEIDETLLLFTGGTRNEDIVYGTLYATNDKADKDLDGYDGCFVTENSDLLPFKAVHAHFPGAEDELEVLVGDVIFISKIFEDGWGYGLNGRTGILGVFPLFVVEFINETSSESSA